LGETRIQLHQQSSLPWEGDVRYTMKVSEPTLFALALRIPDWCTQATIIVNDTAIPLEGAMMDGYAFIEREWRSGDVVELFLEMSAMRVRSHPLVKHNIGKVALQRGPLVYCLEEADNGSLLGQLVLPQDAELQVSWE